VAFTFIFGIGTWLGYLSLRYNRKGEAVEARKEGWLDKNQRKIAVWLLRKVGGALAFVVIAYMGGAIVFGWWFGRKHDPRAMTMVVLSALCLAVTSAPAWVSGFNPQYRQLTPFIVIALPILALVTNLIWRPRQLQS
jgi:ABC-type polysaccharide/polyol phosphate export permease